MNPQQRTAVITDAESCLGKQLTRTLLDEHYRVIGVFSNEQAMQTFMQGPDNKPSFYRLLVTVIQPTLRMKLSSRELFISEISMSSFIIPEHLSANLLKQQPLMIFSI